MSNAAPPSFQPLTGIYEPSAIQLLPDGRFLVAEDEKEHPLSLVTLGSDGTVKTQALKAGLLQMFSSFWKLDDLEGLTADQSGHIYGVTLHSRDGDGDERAARQKLVRFQIDGDRVEAPQVQQGLKQALTTQHAVLAAAAQVLDVKASGGLNIEGLEISPCQQRLLVGFRSPLLGGKALVATIENPGAPVQRVSVAGLPGFAKAEGVCPANVGGVDCIIIVSDDGDRKAGRAAGYLLLELSALRPAV